MDLLGKTYTLYAISECQPNLLEGAAIWAAGGAVRVVEGANKANGEEIIDEEEKEERQCNEY